MPQDLPGLYFDVEKNRYFPVQGRIPGSSRNVPVSAGKEKLIPEKKRPNGACFRTARLLQVRELCGNVITSRKGKVNFQEQFQKIQASNPTIWKYAGSERIFDVALGHAHSYIDTPDGSIKSEILLACGSSGDLCVHEVGNVDERFDSGIKILPDRVRPRMIENQAETSKTHGCLWMPARSSIEISDISSIKVSKNESSSVQCALITSLRGPVYLMNLMEIDYDPSVSMITQRLKHITLFNSTIWTADYNADGCQAVIGSNHGAAIVDLEGRRSSWIFRCRSDVFSVQYGNSRNIVLCGLRNGAIVMVDTRQRSAESSRRLTIHQLPLPSTLHRPSGSSKKIYKKWFELKSNHYPSCTISMPSSISCLSSLKLHDQYFLASSMDGSIRLYDWRYTQRGAVQSYEGNVNSHTRIQFGVDPSERFLVSGGEDCYLRTWSIKSGEMLFEEKFMDSVPSVMCWPQGGREKHEDHGCNNLSGFWLASREGLYSVDYSNEF